MYKIFSIKNSVIAIIALFLFTAPITTLADNDCETATGLDKAKYCMSDTAEKGFGSIDNESLSAKIGRIIGIILSFVGVIFLVLIIYAGFTWMIARGNESEAKKAKDLMYDAVLGLIVILSAYAITAFVGDSLVK